MDHCLQCEAELVHEKGKRKKQFCNETCRSNFWYAKNKKGKSSDGIIPTIRKYEKKTGKPHNIYKSATEVPDDLKKPNNLAELKELCPHKDGFERSFWISTERKKYGI